jgi:uracil-DNA glycosylase family 4
VAPATDDVLAALGALRAEVEACTRCDLHGTRTRAVPGEGDAAADLMFVGEAPGYHEDQQGRPFVGQAGRLLEQLLASIGLSREQVFIANVLKSRPPNNRDPRPDEIAACQPYLWRQIELIRPKVVCTLGNHATKLLTGNPAGITRVHGQPQATVINGVDLYLYPIFHPAAALYTPAMLTTLKEDFLRLPDLLAHVSPKGGEGDASASPERPVWRPAHHAAPSREATPAAQADLLTAARAAPPDPHPPLTAPEPVAAPVPPDTASPEVVAPPIDPAPPEESALPIGTAPPAPAQPLAAEAASDAAPPPAAASVSGAAQPPAAEPRPADSVATAADSGPPEQLGLF